MTVAEIIEQYNNEHPNKIDDDTKLAWLRKCERMLIREVLDAHEHDLDEDTTLKLVVEGSTLKVEPRGKIEDHIVNFGIDTELLVPEPYDDLYIFYLDQKIAYNNNDSRKYDRAVVQYNNSLLLFKQFVNRTYKPKTKPNKLFNHSSLL